MHQLAEFFEQGGFFMYVNLLCSVITITLIADRAVFFLGKAAVSPRAFLEQLRKLVFAGQIDKATRLCQTTEAPVAVVARAGLSRLPRGESAVATAIEEALTDTMPELKKRIAVLWSLANIATLIGLLGTITGLIGAFAAVGKAAADQRAQMLARNIAEAMNNTWLGLAIAATCMIGHVFLQQASKKHQQELESFALKLENLLLDSLREPRRAEESEDAEPQKPQRETREPARDREPARSGAASRERGSVHEARTGRPGRRVAEEIREEDEE
jgi:biopolymer transport protein ExbB/TolQ